MNNRIHKEPSLPDYACPVDPFHHAEVRVTTEVAAGATTITSECADCNAFIARVVHPKARPDLFDVKADRSPSAAYASVPLIPPTFSPDGKLSVEEWTRRYATNTPDDIDEFYRRSN